MNDKPSFSEVAQEGNVSQDLSGIEDRGNDSGRFEVEYE